MNRVNIKYCILIVLVGHLTTGCYKMNVDQDQSTQEVASEFKAESNDSLIPESEDVDLSIDVTFKLSTSDTVSRTFSGLYVQANLECEVYTPDHPENPAPKAGEFTYVYHIESDVSSDGPITDFEFVCNGGEDSNTTSYLNDAGVYPQADSVGSMNACYFGFNTTPILPGERSSSLIVYSTRTPEVSDLGEANFVFLGVSATCLYPSGPELGE